MSKPFTGLVINPDNTYKEVTINDYTEIAPAIDCSIFCVIPNYYNRSYSMFGDDEALLRDEDTIQWNGVASQYYGVFEHGQPIAGSVLVTGNPDEEGETTSLSDEDMAILKHTLDTVNRIESVIMREPTESEMP